MLVARSPMRVFESSNLETQNRANHTDERTRMRFKRTWLWLAVLTVGLSLVAFGCGGGDDDDGDDGGGGAAAEQVITVNWGTEPPSLDPGLASDTTSAAIIFNIMEPLFTLDNDLNAVEN